MFKRKKSVNNTAAITAVIFVVILMLPTIIQLTHEFYSNGHNHNALNQSKALHLEQTPKHCGIFLFHYFPLKANTFLHFFTYQKVDFSRIIFSLKEQLFENVFLENNGSRAPPIS